MHTLLSCRSEKTTEDYTFRRQSTEPPSVTPGCPGLLSCTVWLEEASPLCPFMFQSLCQDWKAGSSCIGHTCWHVVFPVEQGLIELTA